MKQLLMFLCCVISLQAYTQVGYSELGTGGVSSNGFIIQSIGQNGVVSTDFKDGLQVGVGLLPILVFQNIKDPDQYEEINGRFYPNPVIDWVNVNLEGNFSGSMEVRVYDLNGRMVFDNTRSFSSSFKIDLGHLTSGIYVIQVFCNNKLFHSKLIKQK